MRNRFNICPETAVSKASERLFPGVHLTFNAAANNDEQCDLSTLFAKIPGRDLMIDNPGLGGQSRAVDHAATVAMQRVKDESGLKDAQGHSETLEARMTRLAGDDFDALITRLEQPDILEERNKFNRYMTEELANVITPIRNLLTHEFQQLTPPTTYILRTGTVGTGSGHFHALYYDAPNWMLDSGFKDGQPNKGILYNTQTHELGPMADQLIDASKSWGRGQGQRMLAIYEMNPLRTLIVAKYIEKFRQLSLEETETIFPEVFINEIIANPSYLSSFGSEGYWQAQRQGQHFSLPVVSPSEYIRLALEQCTTQDLGGAVLQLESKGYFSNPTQGRTLLSTLLAHNKADAVREILNRNLVDLTNPQYARALYRSALQYSHNHVDCPPGCNVSLRALQNKLLDVLPFKDLPFTIQNTCEALNGDALRRMLDLESVIDYNDLHSQIMAAAHACNVNEGTYAPLLKIVDDHKQSCLKLEQTKRRVQPKEAITRIDNKHKSRNDLSDSKEPLKTELLTLVKNNRNESPENVWEKACQVLENRSDYVYTAAERFKRNTRPVIYQAERANGTIITKIVAERDQILLDKLYAKKLEAEYNKEDDSRFRRYR